MRSGFLAVASALLLASAASAADTVVYDDASQPGYDEGCSFNGVASDFDFANADPVHAGIHSIRFTPETFDAVSWCFTLSAATTADISGISFWVNGGATGGQDIQFAFAYNGGPVAQASLATLNGGVPLPANTWVHLTASFDAAPTQYAGNFDKIWFLSNTSAAQPDVFIDDVVLLGRISNAIFANGFESSRFRGTNLVGMEMDYHFDQAQGPAADSNYPTYDTRDIDYFAGKHVGAFRFLFSWEGMQSTLNGPIPAAANGNYKLYFDNYKRVVDYATALGIRVIVEPWQANSGGGAGGARWRGDVVGSLAVPTSAFADFWSKIATVFKDNPNVSYGLVNEPNDMSTMSWFASAQAAVTAIRATGSTQRIYVPGNGYTAASSWTQDYYDTAATPHSNAYGWLNANGPGQALTDPGNNMVAEVHCYLDNDASGSTTGIVSATIARERLAVAVDEAAAHGYQVYLGEIGFYAGNPTAAAAWADFIDYFNNTGTLVGYTWWAGGMPGWWPDVGANGGGHFSITPTSGATFTGDTVNMQMIQADF